MKKNNQKSTILIAVVALFAGFFIGVFFSGGTFTESEMAGTIGRLDNQRNVQITEDDIRLRNEIADNLELRDVYVDFLNYFYMKALRTSQNLYDIMQKAEQVEAFSEVYANHEPALKTYESFLDVARTDILQASSTLMNIERQQNVPVVELLNQANNAIHRIRSHDNALFNFMQDVNAFLQAQDTFYEEIADVHDMIYFHSIESAMVYDNKPVYNQLRELALKNQLDGVEKVLRYYILSEEGLQGSVLFDNQRLGLDETLNQAVLNSAIRQQLELSSTMNQSLQSIAFLSQEGLRGFSDQQMNGFLNEFQLQSQTNLGALNVINSQVLNLDFRVGGFEQLDGITAL